MRSTTTHRIPTEISAALDEFTKCGSKPDPAIALAALPSDMLAIIQEIGGTDDPAKLAAQAVRRHQNTIQADEAAEQNQKRRREKTLTLTTSQLRTFQKLSHHFGQRRTRHFIIDGQEETCECREYKISVILATRPNGTTAVSIEEV